MWTKARAMSGSLSSFICTYKPAMLSMSSACASQEGNCRHRAPQRPPQTAVRLLALTQPQGAWRQAILACPRAIIQHRHARPTHVSEMALSLPAAPQRCHATLPRSCWPAAQCPPPPDSCPQRCMPCAQPHDVQARHESIRTMHSESCCRHVDAATVSATMAHCKGICPHS